MYFFHRWKNHTHRHRLQDLQQRINQLTNALAQADTQKPAYPASLFSTFSSNPNSFFIPHDTTHDTITDQKTHHLPRTSTYKPLNLTLESPQSKPSPPNQQPVLSSIDTDARTRNRSALIQRTVS